MKIETKTYLLIASIIIAVSLFLYQYNMQKSYQEEIKSFEIFKQDASKLIAFRRESKNSQRVLGRIIKRFNLVSHSKRASLHKMVFKDMDKKEFSKLIDILLNSTLYIKKMDVKKLKNKVVLRLEVEI